MSKVTRKAINKAHAHKLYKQYIVKTDEEKECLKNKGSSLVASIKNGEVRNVDKASFQLTLAREAIANRPRRRNTSFEAEADGVKRYSANYKQKTKRSYPAGFNIHHIDFNRGNNAIENLVALPILLHEKYHRVVSKIESFAATNTENQTERVLRLLERNRYSPTLINGIYKNTLDIKDILIDGADFLTFQEVKRIESQYNELYDTVDQVVRWCNYKQFLLIENKDLIYDYRSFLLTYQEFIQDEDLTFCY